MKRAERPSSTRHRRTAAPAPAGAPGAPGPQDPGHRWLLLIHQLPTSPSNLRVRTWRRLQQLGAVAVTQAAYTLPDTVSAREDFAWLRSEVEAAGGEVSVFTAAAIDGHSDADLIDAFRRARDADYAALARAVERGAREQRATRKGAARGSVRHRQRLETLRRRLAAIERIDFFGSAGRDRVVEALLALEETSHPPGGLARDGVPPRIEAGAYHGRVWVTRPRPGVDRMASAWLIRRFIDPQATFGFVTDARGAAPPAIPFDMFGVEFSHSGARCTFEVLCARFGIDEPGLARLAAIVHDLDFKDERFGAPEAGTVGIAIEGLQMAHADDHALLEHGMTLFEALYRSLARSFRPTRRR